MTAMASPPLVHAAPDMYRALIAHVIATVRSDVAYPYTTETFGEIANLSPFHFARVFREVVGVPPGVFLAALRVDEAKRRLIETDQPVTEITFDVGYGSLGSFSSKFRQVVGVGPQRYREIPEQLDRLPLTQPILRSPHQSLARVSGTVTSPPGVTSAVYLGLFPTGMAQGEPVAGIYLPEAGPFEVTGVPLGTYLLLAAGIPSPGDVNAHLRTNGETLLASHPEAVRIEHGTEAVRRDMVLRAGDPLDAPVLVALPNLILPTEPQSHIAQS